MNVYNKETRIKIKNRYAYLCYKIVKIKMYMCHKTLNSFMAHLHYGCVIVYNVEEFHVYI